MFLKRRNIKLQWLRKKHFIDLWGQYKKKKKYFNRHYQRFLLRFSRLLDRTLYRQTKIIKNFTYFRWRIKRPRLYPRDRLGRLNKRSIEYKRPLTYRKILKFYTTLFAYRKINKSKYVIRTMNLYNRWKQRLRRLYSPFTLDRVFVKKVRGTLLRRWHRRWARKIAWINTRRYRIKPDEFRRIYLKPGRNIHIETIRQQHYYGFNKVKTFLAFFKKFEIGFNSFKIGLGLEGLLSHLLFRCNLVPTVRAAHLLLRLRAIYINDRKPIFVFHKCLKVGDSFGVFPRYIRSVHRLLKISLKRRLVKLNIPNYLEYNYRLMFFFIWRKPTLRERAFLHHSPYKKSVPLRPFTSRRHSKEAVF